MRTKEFDGGLFAADIKSVVIGIDQSYSGFAITAMHSPDCYYTWVHKADGVGITRLQNIQSWMIETFEHIEWHVPIVDSSIEGYAFGAQMAHMAGELGATVKLTLVSHFKNQAAYPLIVTPSMLKKYVTGKGTGVQKNQMLLHTYKTWGVEFSDDNACDSYGLAVIALHDPKYAYQKEVALKLKDPKFREMPL